MKDPSSMMDNEIFMDAIADALGVDVTQLTDATRLDAANWDSLAHLATIAAIDEKFDVTIPANDLTAVRTVGELRQLVAQAVRKSVSS